jgi:hypothetical protein
VKKRGERRACRLHALLGIAVVATGETFAGEARAGDSATSLAPSGDEPLKTPVHIERSSCKTVPITEVLGVLRVELAAQLVEWPLPDKVYQVAIDCSDEVVVISVAMTKRETRSYRTNLTNAPSNVRPRIVALAIAEIVRDLDRESAKLALASPVRQEVPPPQTVLEPPPPKEGDTRPAQFGVFAAVSTFHFDGSWLAGGGPHFDYVYRWLCAGFDAALLEGDHRFTTGIVRALLGYGSPYVAWRGVTGYALGAATVTGLGPSNYLSSTLTGPWAAPYVFGALAFAVTHSITVDLRAQAGWVTMSVLGQVQRVPGGADVNLDGLWTSMQIGTAFTL